MASNGHFFTQIPQPIHSSSDMWEILDSAVTSIHNLPVLLTGLKGKEGGGQWKRKEITNQDRLHSWLHFFGLHRSPLTMAIRVKDSCSRSCLSGRRPCISLSFDRREIYNERVFIADEDFERTRKILRNSLTEISDRDENTNSTPRWRFENNQFSNLLPEREAECVFRLGIQ